MLFNDPISGPLKVQHGETVRFWSDTLGINVEEGSVLVMFDGVTGSGAPGPTGPAGPQDPTGPDDGAGPQGPTGLDGGPTSIGNSYSTTGSIDPNSNNQYIVKYSSSQGGFYELDLPDPNCLIKKCIFSENPEYKINTDGKIIFPDTSTIEGSALYSSVDLIPSCDGTK